MAGQENDPDQENIDMKVEKRLSEESAYTSSETTEVSTDNAKIAAEEESLSAKARESGRLFKELVEAVIKKSKLVAQQKNRELKEVAGDPTPELARDASVINELGDHITESQMCLRT